jgi:hypothetical protein
MNAGSEAGGCNPEATLLLDAVEGRPEVFAKPYQSESRVY